MADKMAKADDFHQLHSDATALGCRDIETPQGVVHFHDCSGVMTCLITLPDRDTTVGVMAYNPAKPGEPRGDGLIGQLDAAAARNIGASLIRLANEIDPRSAQ